MDGSVRGVYMMHSTALADWLATKMELELIPIAFLGVYIPVVMHIGSALCQQ